MLKIIYKNKFPTIVQVILIYIMKVIVLLTLKKLKKYWINLNSKNRNNKIWNLLKNDYKITLLIIK